MDSDTAQLIADAINNLAETNLELAKAIRENTAALLPEKEPEEVIME